MKTSYFYSLRINGNKNSGAEEVASVSLSQLAELLLEFSRLLGYKDRVSFNSIQKGSLVAVAEVADSFTKDEIEHRISFASSWESSGQPIRRAPVEAAAYLSLNRMLQKNQLAGSIGYTEDLESSHFKTILTLGSSEEWAEESVFQSGTLDGVVVRIGDSPNTPDVPVHLESRSGERYLCRASRELAFEMGRYPVGTFTRVHGRGEWSKEPRRQWRVRNFRIESHKIVPLQQGFKAALKRLSKTELARKLSRMEDPDGYLKGLREGRTS